MTNYLVHTNFGTVYQVLMYALLVTLKNLPGFPPFQCWQPYSLVTII